MLQARRGARHSVARTVGAGLSGFRVWLWQRQAPAAGSSTGRRRRCPPSARPGNGAGSGLQQLSPGVKDQHQGGSRSPSTGDRPPAAGRLRRAQMGTDAFPGQGLQPDGPELPGEAGQAPHVEAGGGDHLNPRPPGPVLHAPGHGVPHGRGNFIEAVQEEHQPGPPFPAPPGQLLQLLELGCLFQNLPLDVCANEVVLGPPAGRGGDVDGGDVAGQEMLPGGEERRATVFPMPPSPPASGGFGWDCSSSPGKTPPGAGALPPRCPGPGIPPAGSGPRGNRFSSTSISWKLGCWLRVLVRRSARS